MKNLPAGDSGDPVRSLCRQDPKEWEMAIPTDVLAWKISWTEEPGRLWSRGLGRTGQLSTHEPKRNL